MKNLELAKLFDTFADIHEIIEDQNSKFKVRAYRQASMTLQNLGKDILEFIDLENENFTQKIPGFGPAIISKILEYLKTNQIKELNELKSLVPPGLLDMLELKNVGPKKVKKFYQELNIKNIAELKTAIEKNQVQELDGMGQKSTQKILEAIKNFESYSKRTPIGKIYKDLQEIITVIRQHPNIDQAAIAGSARRFQETIGDVDVLVSAEKQFHPNIINFYKGLPYLKSIEAEGPTKVTAYLNSGTQIDFRIVQPDEFGAALQYFSGNQAHNVKLRTIAKQQGYKINEYGIFKNSDNSKVGGTTEKEIYNTLGLQFVPVFLRQGNNELDLAEKNQIPNLVKHSDIQGDLHCHSTFSDGKNTIEEMALKAIELGYEYLAITDHSQNLKVANGMSIEQLKFKKAEIEKLKAKLNFLILYGTEVDILNDGTIDYPDSVLSEFDVVIGSIHNNLLTNTQERILKAMNNKYVQIIGHPTTRLINKREGANLDFKQLFKEASNTGTLFELNAQPLRLDLPDQYIREAKENYNLKFCINTDAHSVQELNFMDLGVNYGKRGWLTKEDIINTYSATNLLKVLKQKTN